MSGQELNVRRITPADASAYYALRVRSRKGLAGPPEPKILDELDAGSAGMADLLERYEHEGTSLWGAFDRQVLAGVLCLSWRIGIESPDEALLWGIHVLPRYRGTAVSRLLMEAAVAWCEANPLHWMTVHVERDNVHACQYLGRFGFERVAADGEGIEDGRSVVRMRRRI